MSFANHNRAASSLVVRLFGVFLFFVAALAASPAAWSLDTGDIVISSLKGEVHFEVRGSSTVLRSGGVLELPATLRTGRDGAVELRQGATSISVGPDTLLEFPALKEAGGPIDRIVQPRGNAFYSIGKRNGRKLRIETPFLVGVVKGTQFNVAAQDHATTISLFEGLLEVRSADDSDVIDLRAGEIASRDQMASDISVFKMEGSKTPPIPKPSAGTGSGSGALPPSAPAAAPTSRPAPPPAPAPRSDNGESGHARPGHGNSAAAPAETHGASQSGVAGGLLDASVDLGVSESSGRGKGNSVNVDLGVSESSGKGNGNSPSVDLGVSESSGKGKGDSVNVDLGVSESSGKGKGNSPSVDLGVSESSGKGKGDSVNVDLGVNESSGKSKGDSVNVDLGASDNSGNGHGNSANVDLSAGANVGSSATPDTGIDVGIDVDLGLDANDPGKGNGNGNGSGNSSGNGNGNNANPGNAIDDVTDIVNNLLKKPGRK